MSTLTMYIGGVYTIYVYTYTSIQRMYISASVTNYT